MNGIAISQQPTITISVSQSDSSTYDQVIKQQASVKVKLFGVCTVGSASNSVYKSTSKSNSSVSGFDIVLKPVPGSYISASPKDSRAMVLGAQVVYPGTY
jgi:hypothetical protein